MDRVHGGGPWTRGPCFVLSRAKGRNGGRRGEIFHFAQNWGQMFRNWNSGHFKVSVSYLEPFAGF